MLELPLLLVPGALTFIPALFPMPSVSTSFPAVFPPVVDLVFDGAYKFLSK